MVLASALLPSSKASHRHFESDSTSDFAGFHLKPVGFFTKNPANDLPSGRDTSSVLYQPGQSQTDIRCHL